MCKKCYLDILSTMSREFYLIMGDHGYFYGTPKGFNAVLCLLELLVIISQFIHYYNYRNGIKPMDLRVFQMISGLISPKSIQINDKLLVYKLIKITNFSLINLPRCVNLFTIATFVITFILLSTISSQIQIFTIVIPNAILWAIFQSTLEYIWISNY